MKKPHHYIVDIFICIIGTIVATYIINYNGQVLKHESQFGKFVTISNLECQFRTDDGILIDCIFESINQARTAQRIMKNNLETAITYNLRSGFINKKEIVSIWIR